MKTYIQKLTVVNKLTKLLEHAKRRNTVNGIRKQLCLYQQNGLKMFIIQIIIEVFS